MYEKTILSAYDNHSFLPEINLNFIHFNIYATIHCCSHKSPCNAHVLTFFFPMLYMYVDMMLVYRLSLIFALIVVKNNI